MMNSAPIRQHHPTPHSAEEGYILIWVIFLVAVFTLALSIAVPDVAKQIKRDRELETMRRGKQYMRAIQLYYRKFHAYPPNVNALVNTNQIRFLRKKYIDPITGKDDWKPILFGQAKTQTLGFFGQPIAGAGSAGGSVMAGVGPSGGSGIGGSTLGSGGSTFGSGGSSFGSGGSSFVQGSVRAAPRSVQVVRRSVQGSVRAALQRVREGVREGVREEPGQMAIRAAARAPIPDKTGKPSAAPASSAFRPPAQARQSWFIRRRAITTSGSLSTTRSPTWSPSRATLGTLVSLPAAPPPRSAVPLSATVRLLAQASAPIQQHLRPPRPDPLPKPPRSSPRQAVSRAQKTRSLRGAGLFARKPSRNAVVRR